MYTVSGQMLRVHHIDPDVMARYLAARRLDLLSMTRNITFNVLKLAYC